MLLREHVKSHRSGLAAAMLLGTRELVTPETAEDFLESGTVHLLAISGLHLGILVSGLWWLRRLRLLSRRGLLYTAIAFVVFYALVADARPPVVRAAILVGVMCTASLCGRQSLGMNALAFAGLLLLIVNPSNLFQTGPQLSFLAVTTLGVVAREGRLHNRKRSSLDRLIAQSRPWPIRAARYVVGSLAGFCLTSTSIWVVSLPLVMYRFHVVAPVGMVVNPLVVIPMASALYSGFAVLCIGWIAPPFAAFCGWCCDTSLAAIQWAVELGLCLQGNHVWIPAPPWWWVAGFYAALGLGMVCLWRPPPLRWVAALIAAWFALGFGYSLGSRLPRAAGDPELVCTFIAVGHGTSVLIELPTGQAILYDAGQLGSPSTVAAKVASVIWSRGRDHLDAVIISHADVDHFNALPALLERFTVGTVYITPIMLRDDTAAVRALVRAIGAHRIPIRRIAAGASLDVMGSTSIDVLHPPAMGVPGSDNANSIVLMVEHGGRRLLLPGDLEEQGLDELLSQAPLDCDVIMAPHHGSPRSDPDSFSAWCTPEWSIISGGRRIAAVEQAFRSAGAQVLSTAEDGAVQVRISKQGVDVRSWLADSW